jgi:hypothetical protein
MNSVWHKGNVILVDKRTMVELELRQGQSVDETMMWRIIEHNYAWCVTEMELAKAAGVGRTVSARKTARKA